MARSAAAAAAALRVLRSPAKPLSGKQAFHTGQVKQMAHGHDSHAGGRDYEHAYHMYDLPAMKHRKLKMGILVFGALGIGIAVPIYAVMFQMKKQSVS